MALSLKTMLPNPEASAALDIVEGAPQGGRYGLPLGGTLSIGRSEENEIVFPVEGVSRRHAVLTKGPEGGWALSDNESKNGVFVNGKPVERRILASGDIIQIGPVKLRFSEGFSSSEDLAALPSVAREKPQLNRRVLLYGGAALALTLVYFLQSQTTTPEVSEGPKKETTLTPDLKLGQSEKAPGLEDPSLSKAEQQTSSLPWENNPLREAEQYFKRGQREYLSKNYIRAIDLFQAALSLDRNHALSKQYVRLAVYEAQVESKKNWEMGIKYFESLQFQRAIYHFNQVIALNSYKPSDPTSREAEKYAAVAKKRLQAVELFP